MPAQCQANRNPERSWEILRTEYAKHAAVWFQDNDLIVLRLAES